MDLYLESPCFSADGQHLPSESGGYCIICGLVLKAGQPAPVPRSALKRQRRAERRAAAVGAVALGPNKTHLALMERDGDHCFYCGLDFSVAGARTTDHFIPYARGGASSLRNYRLACLVCNGSKGDHIWVLTGGRWMQLDEEKGTLSVAKINAELPPSQVAG